MKEQRDIFQLVESPSSAAPDGTSVIADVAAFPELCTALYERELAQLAALPNVSSAAGLQRRLKSVSYYVKKAARAMLTHQNTCQLDVQNASWHAPQKRKLTATTTRASKLEKWLASGRAELGCSVPVLDFSARLQRVYLDSIDRIDTEKRQVHCNFSGWFSYAGEPLDADHQSLLLAKPDKNTLSAAMSGHQWNHRGKIDPRTLSLREILLATAIDWSQL